MKKCLLMILVIIAGTAMAKAGSGGSHVGNGYFEGGTGVRGGKVFQMSQEYNGGHSGNGVTDSNEKGNGRSAGDKTGNGRTCSGGGHTEKSL